MALRNNGAREEDWLAKAALILMICVIVPCQSGKKVVNYMQSRDSHPSTSKPKFYQIPVSRKLNMEDIVNSPPFRDRISDVANDPNVWSAALSIYDDNLQNNPQKRGDRKADDPLGNVMMRPSMFVPWASDNSDDPHLRHKDEANETEFDKVDEGTNYHGGPSEGPPHRHRHEPHESNYHESVDGGGSNHNHSEAGSRNDSREFARGIEGGIEVETIPDNAKSDTGSKIPSPPPPPSASTDGGKARQSNTCSRGGQGDPTREVTFAERLLQNSIMDNERLYGGCGGAHPHGKSCFGVPAGCIENGNCRLVVTLSLDPESPPEQITVNLAGESYDNGFVAVGFTHGRFLERDFVVYCINTMTEVAGERKVALYSALTDGMRVDRAHMQRNANSYHSNFCLINGYQTTGVHTCSFKLSTNVTLDGGEESLDIYRNEYYLMLAFGHYLDILPRDGPGYGALKSTDLIQWSDDRKSLEERLKDPKNVEPRSRTLLLLHVIPAVFSIVFLIPAGMIQAKYGKEIIGYKSKFYGRFYFPGWLRAHLRLSAMSVPLMITSIICILIELDFTWRSDHTWPFIHSLCGILSTIFLGVSMILGCFFNCDMKKLEKNQEPKMKPLRWAHWLIGNLTYVFGIVCVLTSTSMSMSLAPCFVDYFGYLHVAIHVISHVAMMFDTKKLAKKFQEDQYMFQRVFLGPMVVFTNCKKFNKFRESKGEDEWKGRRLVIMYYFIASFLCAFTISVLMLLPIVLCR